MNSKKTAPKTKRKVDLRVKPNSKNFNSVQSRILSDPAVRKRFTCPPGVPAFTQLLKDFEIIIDDIAKLRKIAFEFTEVNKPTGLDMTVNISGVITTVTTTDSTQCYRGYVHSPDKTFSNGLVTASVDTLMGLFNFETTDSLSAITMQNSNDQIDMKLTDVNTLAMKISDKKITSSQDVREVLTDLYTDPEQSKIATAAIISASPKIVRMLTGSTASADDKTVKVEVPLPRVYVLKDFTEDMCRAILYEHTKLTYPSSSGLFEHAARHIYGIQIPKLHRKYFELATDLYVPNRIKVLHLYSSDATYASILSNIYPNCTIRVLSKRTVQDNKSKISTMTSYGMIREIDKKNTMGIWPESLDNASARDADTSALLKSQLEEASEDFNRYHVRFRYLNVFAGDPEKKYSPCTRVRRLLIVEGYARGKNMPYKDALQKVASGVLHSYVFPFIYTPLIQLASDIYPPLHDRYSTYINITRVGMSLAMLSELQSDKLNETFSDMCIVPQAKGGSTNNTKSNNNNKKNVKSSKNNGNEEISRDELLAIQMTIDDEQQVNAPKHIKKEKPPEVPDESSDEDQQSNSADDLDDEEDYDGGSDQENQFDDDNNEDYVNDDEEDGREAPSSKDVDTEKSTFAALQF